jgi:acetyltransferase
MTLARDMISRTQIFKLLRGYRNRPAANLDAICLTLMQVSQLIIDIPEILELDINPLFADAQGVLALDARIRIARSETSGTDRLAIRPYPKMLEQKVTLSDGWEMLLRPIRPEDEPAHQIFFTHLSREDIRLRFFNAIKELPHTEMARLTQIDYDREMAFIAIAPDGNGHGETYGVVRAITDPNNEQAEFAVIVRSDLKGQGLGRVLMEKIVDYCRSRGTKRIMGQVLKENTSMLSLANRLGFERSLDSAEGTWELSLDLQGQTDVLLRYSASA